MGHKKAAEQGLAWAQEQLGNMYFDGEGADQDYAEAAKWLRKAAEQGHTEAQLLLGDMYRLGHGVDRMGLPTVYVQSVEPSALMQ